MKALVKSKAQRGIWMQEVPLPQMGQNDILVEISKTAICGTDVHIYNWDEWSARTIPVPLTTGHEFVGTIVAVGSEVTGFEVGERVSGEGHITCGHCRNCRAGKRHLCRNTQGIGIHRTGCFAEYLAIPASNAFKIDPVIPDDIAAILDPLGNATHSALSFDMVGEDVLITGAGPIGIMAAAICRHIGARHIVITDVNDYRLNLAAQLGATRTVNVKREKLSAVLSDLNIQEGFSIGLEMSGNADALSACLQHMTHGGHVALLGIPPQAIALDLNQVIFKGLQLKGIYGREMFETWHKMTNMLSGGLDISAIVTHTYPIDEFQKGFDTMLSGQSGKVVLNWKE